MVQVVQVIQVVRMISLDDIYSENIWFSWCKPSNYREKLVCHACDGGRTEEEEIGNWCSVLADQKPQKGKGFESGQFDLRDAFVFAHC